ncbi:hypothetical protein ACLKA7_003577 [Drosophila subpalustris]
MSPSLEFDFDFDLDLPQCTAQFWLHTSWHTSWDAGILPGWRLSTLNNEAIFALNSHTQPITSELSLEFRLVEARGSSSSSREGRELEEIRRLFTGQLEQLAEWTMSWMVN